MRFKFGIVFAILATCIFATSAAAYAPLPPIKPFELGRPAIEYPVAMANFAPPAYQPQRIAQAPANTSPSTVTTTAPSPNSVGGTTVTTSGDVKSDTTISVGTLAGQALQWVLTAFLVPIGGIVTAILMRVFSGVGLNMSTKNSENLQAMVERGLVWAASTVQKGLDGKIPVDTKSTVIAKAVAYVQEHGADTIKALGGNPNSTATQTALTARAETALANPAVPVAVAPAAPATGPAVVDHLDELAQKIAGLISGKSSTPAV